MTTRPRRAAAVLLVVAAVHGLALWAAPAPRGGDPVPPARLADTGLYAPGRSDAIDSRVRPFAPQYPLWTDGAAKRRWISLPAGQTIDGSDTAAWKFPVGTRFWKEFSFHGRKVETRMLWKASDARWVGVSYVWNEEGTDAVLAPDGGVPGVVEVAPYRRHSIPSRSDCATCHSARLEPLGFNALQLSTDRDPHAIHGEPLTEGMVSVKTLVDEGLLASAGRDVVDRPPRIATADAKTRTVLGYLSANCGSCHDGTSAISAQVPSLKFTDLMRDGDAVARSLIGAQTRWQAPGRSEGTVLVDPVSPDASALLLRMSSRRPSSQMPPIGTVVRDQEAIEAVTEWIKTGTSSR
jgi:hypothetical protein